MPAPESLMYSTRNFIGLRVFFSTSHLLVCCGVPFADLLDVDFEVRVDAFLAVAFVGVSLNLEGTARKNLRGSVADVETLVVSSTCPLLALVCGESVVKQHGSSQEVRLVL